jgi:hypothetical protein
MRASALECMQAFPSMFFRIHYQQLSYWTLHKERVQLKSVVQETKTQSFVSVIMLTNNFYICIYRFPLCNTTGVLDVVYSSVVYSIDVRVK